MLGLIFMFAGEFLINKMGGFERFPGFVKDAHEYVQNNKFQFGLACMLVASTVQINLMKTGAFEISVNGNLEYSKLETNKMPDLSTIKSILSKYNVDL